MSRGISRSPLPLHSRRCQSWRNTSYRAYRSNGRSKGSLSGKPSCRRGIQFQLALSKSRSGDGRKATITSTLNKMASSSRKKSTFNYYRSIYTINHLDTKFHQKSTNLFWTMCHVSQQIHEGVQFYGLVHAIYCTLCNVMVLKEQGKVHYALHEIRARSHNVEGLTIIMT